MIEFILIYILVGVVVAMIFNWNEISEVFDRCERDSQNPLTKGERQEFIILISTCVFGWGFFVIYLFIVDPVKNLINKYRK